MNAPGELWTVAEALGDLVHEVVFVGGMVPGLLFTDPAAGSLRPTEDVDCIVDVSRASYVELSERLRARGFSECPDEGAPICRWIVRGVRVDIMPTDPGILGFTNVWYRSTIEHSVRVDGPKGRIRIPDAVHFCATKIESYLSRGEGDLFHHDLEDLIALVDARVELGDEIQRAPKDVREFIAQIIGQWLRDRRFIDALSGHLRGDAASQGRMPILLQRLRAIASLIVEEPKPLPRRPAPFPAIGNVPRRPVGLPLHAELSSSNLSAASYEPDRLVLTVEFHRGRAYEYAGVPQGVYEGLLRAASHGRYFNEWIRDRYPMTRLR